MRQFNQPLLLGIFLALLWIPASISAHKRNLHKDAPGLTNAERFARGLPPATPRRLYNPDRVKATRDSPSGLPSPSCGCQIGGVEACEQRFFVRALRADDLTYIGYLSWDEDEEMWVILYDNVPFSSSASTPFSISTRDSSGRSIYFHLYCPGGDHQCDSSTVPGDQRPGVVTGNAFSSSSPNRQPYIWSVDESGSSTVTWSQAGNDYTVDLYTSPNQQSLQFALSPSDWFQANPSTSDYIRVTFVFLDACGGH